MGTEFVTWLDHTSWSDWLRAEPWRYPLIETFHLAGLVMWFGAVLIVDLRLLGVMMRRQPAGEIASGVAPIAWTALAVQFISGPLLFMANAIRTSPKASWRIKLVLLAAALLYHFTVHRRVSMDPDAGGKRAAAVASLALWLGVAVSGLWINA